MTKEPFIDRLRLHILLKIGVQRVIDFARYLGILAILFAVSGASAEGDREQNRGIGSRLTDGDDTIALVSGEVTRVKNPPNSLTVATIKIIHVYSGAKSLKGTTFDQPTADEGSAGIGTVIACPVLKVGETGLWLMGTDQNTGNACWISNSRKTDPWTNYDRRIEWAEAIERLVKLKVAERLKLAKEWCGHKAPDVAQLGIEVLFGAYEPDAKRAGVPEFIKDLPKNKAVTQSALVRADEFFFDEHRTKWIESEVRKALQARFTEPLSEADAEVVAHHIIRSRSFQSPDGTWMTTPEAKDKLIMIASDARQSKAARRIIVERVVKTAGGVGIIPDFTFEVLAAVARSGADDSVRLQAVQGLDRPLSATRPQTVSQLYSAAQLATLRDLLKDEKNPDVAKALKTAVDKSK